MATSSLPQSGTSFLRDETTAGSSAGEVRSPSVASSKLSREEEAKRALEHTTIAPGVARSLCLLFLLTIFCVPVLQTVFKTRHHEAILPALERMNTLFPDAPELKAFESNLERDSVATQWVLPRAQSVLMRLGAGNEQAYIGRHGWLVYRPDVDYLTSPGFLNTSVLQARSLAGTSETSPVQPDPVKAIVSFRDQLAERGIRLVIVPTPLKPMLHPEQLAARYNEYSGTLQNSSYPQFLQEMARHNVIVCDPTAQLEKARRRTGVPQFLSTDTHWTPGAMQVAAGALASCIHHNVELPAAQPTHLTRRAVLYSNRGDIATMLKIPAQRSLFLPQQMATETVTTEQVLTDRGNMWKPSSTADVLLLGDSFTNIYSKAAMGWGRSAGLAEQLSFELRRPVDVIAVNAGGASSTRRQLRDDLLRGRDRLSGKRIVVWQFAMRDLAKGNWQLIDLPTTGRSNLSRPATAPATMPRVAPLPSVLRPNNPVVVARFHRALAQKAASLERSGSRVLHGTGGWLFYLPDVHYVGSGGFLRARSNPQIDALVNFKRQLDRRGIKLLVMPAPAKPTIYPEKMGLGVLAPQAPQNPSFARYRQALAAQGISFFDPTETLLAQKRLSSTPMFMPTDSHWSWVAMEATAAQLARHLQTRMNLPARLPVPYTRQAAPVRNITDISMMLKRRPGNSQFVRVRQTIQQVKTADGKLWRPSPAADILVMGDSFINMYSHGGYWGKGAGFAEQLSFYLQRPVDLIAMDRGAVNKTRLALQRDMLQGRDRLAGKKLVIYEVASRYLMGRNWDIIPLPVVKASATKTQPRPPVEYSKAAVPQNIWVRGTIRAHSATPQPDTSPYQDMVMTLRLDNLQAVSAAQSRLVPRGDVIVYLWGMRNGALTPAASWKTGQSVTLRLTPWRAVEEEYGGYDRSDLEGRDAQGQDIARLPMYWAQEKPS
ncbi:MAG TPA: hypothetical protein VF600_18715 [Abditibacteriaceae bacterium]|jgi:hypothetical protein